MGLEARTVNVGGESVAMQWGGLGQGGINPNLPGTQEVRRIRGRLSLVLEDTEFGKVYDQAVVFRLAGYLKPTGR